VKFTEAASLWDNLPKPIESDHPLTMEDIGQNYGWILYRTRAKWSSGTITAHDYALVYFDRERLSGPLLDRARGNSSIEVSTQEMAPKQKDRKLDVLVENAGRINFSHQLRGERKGILKYDPPSGEPAPTKWQMFPLPMDDLATIRFKKKACEGPCFYRATFNVDAPADTFVDTSQLSKGQLWINGHAMGRFWNIGPQKTLYVPGPWLTKGRNEIVVFDVDGKSSNTVEALTKPNLGPTGQSGPE
jgi:beta-galactosidase